MYLTRFRVNTARSDARRLLGSPHRVHGAVNASFPTPPSRDGSGPRVLWRVDRNGTSETLLYIVSPSRPDLTHLVEQAGWPASDEPGWTTFAYADFLTALHPGDTWGFRLTANPVHNIRHKYLKEGEPTKRAAHQTPPAPDAVAAGASGEGGLRGRPEAGGAAAAAGGGRVRVGGTGPVPLAVPAAADTGGGIGEARQ